METFSASVPDSLEIFRKVARPVYIHINLDAVVHNIRLSRSLCKNKNIGVMAVVKGNSFGHGIVPISRHLRQTGSVDRLAVATIDEGVALRKANIQGPIHLLGNTQSCQMSQCVEHHLIPTIADVRAVVEFSNYLKEDYQEINSSIISNVTKNSTPIGAIHIKLDTGLNRYGCHPSKLDEVIKACDEFKVPVEGIMTHLAHSYNKSFSEHQLDIFEHSISPYKYRKYLLHVAATGGILHGHGTQFDLIRLGIGMFGHSIRVDDYGALTELGFIPSLAIKGYPTSVKLCKAGSSVGYNSSYICNSDEWIATFNIGYSEGYCWSLSKKGAHIRRDKTDESCPVVSNINMDTIYVQLPCEPDADEVFTIVTADYDQKTSVMAISRMLGSPPSMFLSGLSPSLPRIYTSDKYGTMEMLCGQSL